MEQRLVKRLNSHINDGHVQSDAHTTREDRAREALITRVGKVVYLVADGIPVLLPERGIGTATRRSEEHTSELQSRGHLVCRLLLEKIKKQYESQVKVASEFGIRRWSNHI